MRTLSKEYPVSLVCEMMEVSRSGYYKWLRRKPSLRDIDRRKILETVRRTHEEHPTHGYRWVRAYMEINEGLKASGCFVHKCFRELGIRAETAHRIRYRPRKAARDRHPNLIYSTWDTVDRPRQVIVSDMTCLKFRNGFRYEVTFYFDVFTKEILSFRLADRRGDRKQYLEGLEDVARLLRGSKERTVLHTDQGSVYASMAYEEIIKDTLIVRSMSRPGKPTDNPVNESLNGWIKEELYAEMKVTRAWDREEVRAQLEKYVKYFNEKRPCFAIGYDTPANYRKRYYNGELPRKNTFETRELSEVPKFVQKMKRKLENQ